MVGAIVQTNQTLNLIAGLLFDLAFAIKLCRMGLWPGLWWGHQLKCIVSNKLTNHKNKTTNVLKSLENICSKVLSTKSNSVIKNSLTKPPIS